MSEAITKHQWIELNRKGIYRAKLIKELKGYIKTCNWHTVQNYFNNNPKMNPAKRIVMEGAIREIINKY